VTTNTRNCTALSIHRRALIHADLSSSDVCGGLA
jgi:hypothetical protein